MQIFSRYCYIWEFPGAQEDEYTRFVLPANRAYLRLVSFINIFGMLLFLVIDFFKQQPIVYPVVLITRSLALAVAGFIMFLSFRKSIQSWQISSSVVILAFTNFGVAMMTAMYANMPPYYLTNLLFLIFVLVVTASGLHFRHALYLNATCLAIFLFFSQVVKQEPFYYSQYPHLFSILIYILIVGMVLENRRRLKFLDFKELEEQKRLVEELNQQKNKIISILSHDIAAPLSSLSGLLNLQTRGLVGPDQIGPYVSQVGDRIENVQLLLQSLIRWSKSQLDGFVPDKKELNVSEVIARTCHQFDSQIREKLLSLNITGNNGISAMGDQDMITLVFRNLFSNAVKFSKPNTPVEIAIDKTDKNVIIKFSNKGETIPTEQREKLFTYQVQSTVGTAGEKGTGLGLAMSAYFIHLNEGKIYLQDSHPELTVFCVELPAC